MRQHTKRTERATVALAAIAVIAVIVAFCARAVTAEAYSTSAASAIVIDASAGEVLYEKNADEKRAIASTTKIVTAITVILNTDDIDAERVVPDEAIGVEGSSLYLKKGEKLRIKDLLYGLMLRSGNDCAVALACLTSGGTDEFAALMNETARLAGATSSHFVNPHGLPDDEHYSTARDLALISAFAMRNDTFREIVSAKVYKECPSPDGGYRTMLNKNKILGMLDGGNGIKTGYTKAAGRCLVSSAKREDREIICVVLGCGPMFEESRDMINEAFEN